MPERLVRHLDDCPACRAYHQRMRRLEERLRAPASEAFSDAAYARIEAGVLDRLRGAGSLSAPAAEAPRRYWRQAAFGTAAAAIVLAAVMVFMRPQPPAAHEAPLDLAALAELWTDTETLTQRIPQWAMRPELSMQAEMGRLTHDAQRAVAFLLNCTPYHPLPEMTNEF